MTSIILPRRGAGGGGHLGRGTRGRRRFAVASVCLPIFLWIVLVGAIPFQDWTLRGEAGAGDPINQILYAALFLALLCASGVPSRRELLCVPVLLVAASGYALLSTLWSVAPLITFRRASLTAMIIWMVFRYVDDLGRVRFLQIQRAALAVILVLNYLAVLLTHYGIHGEVFGESLSIVGNWRGLVPHKNVAGVLCAMTVLMMVFGEGQFHKVIRIAVLVGATIFLLFTQSRTSEVALLVGLASGFFIKPYEASRRVAFSMVMALLLLLGLLIVSSNVRFLTNLLNDPGSLTGRTAIWPLLLEYAGQHLWTGAGFGAFWQVGEASPIWTLTSGWVATYAGHGHNGYLDLLVTIGLPGAILATLGAVIVPLFRLLNSAEIGKPARSLLLAVIVFCATQNLTESGLFYVASVVEVFLIAAVAVTYQIVREAKTGARPAA